MQKVQLLKLKQLLMWQDIMGKAQLHKLKRVLEFQSWKTCICASSKNLETANLPSQVIFPVVFAGVVSMVLAVIVDVMFGVVV